MLKQFLIACVATAASAGALGDSGLKYFPKTYHYYKLYTDQPMGWHRARSFCTGKGGDLVKPTDSFTDETGTHTESEWLTQNFGKFAGRSQAWWVAATNENFEPTWLWTDGSKVTSEFLNTSFPIASGPTGDHYLLMGRSVGGFRAAASFNNIALLATTGTQILAFPLCEFSQI